MATIELKNIKKMYGQVEAIRGVDLSIGNGEMVVLVGPSGCGKSTLLRMIAGLESITSGTLEIAGNDVSRVEPADRDIAMVFQNYALYPHMSVRENLSYGLKNRGMPKDDIARRVAEAADILEIAPLLERRPRQLSGGQRQRVAMGRAIVRNPAAFLFDEPLSNLDAKLRTQMRVEIRRLQRRLKTTSVYVTHDQLEAMTLADRLVVMNAGVIQQIGTPLEVYSKPETLFVASFIGSPPMNLMPLDAIRSTAINLPQLGNGTDVIGVRPDALTLERPDEPAMQLGGIVELVEPLGAEFHVHVRLTETDEVIAAEIPSGRDVTDGGQINLHVRHVDIHRFNSRTERRTDT